LAGSARPERSVIYETVVYGVGTFLSQAISALRGILVAGMLGPKEYGFWKVLQVGLDYLGYTHFGFLHGMARKIPVFRQQGQVEKEALSRSLALTVTFLTAVLAGLAAIIVTVGMTRTTWFAWIGIACVLVPNQLFRYLHMTCLADGRFAVLSLSNMLLAGVSFLVMWLMIPAWGLYGVFAGFAAGYLSGIAFGWVRGVFAFHPAETGEGWTGQGTRDLASQLFQAGFPFMCVDGLFVVWQGVDRLALATLYGARSEALGHYGLSVMIASFAVQIPQVFNRVLFRRTVRAFGQQSSLEPLELSPLRRHIDLPTLAVAGWTPLLLGPCLIGSRAVIHLFLPNYIPAEVPTALQLLGCYWCGVGLLVRNVYTATDRQWRLGGIYGVAILATIGTIYADWWLEGGHSRLGISAGGVGTIVGSVAAALLSIVDICAFLQYKGREVMKLVVQTSIPFLPFCLWTWWLVATRTPWTEASGAMALDVFLSMGTCLLACGPCALWVLWRVLQSRQER
jgi:O-antigen/teichoic acid export membrane protein